jgi:hypothetical protein
MTKSSRFTGFVGDMKKSSRFTGFLLALVGAMVLSNNLDKPRVAALHGSDVLGLVASGMGFGVALVMLCGRFRIRNE